MLGRFKYENNSLYHHCLRAFVIETYHTAWMLRFFLLKYANLETLVILFVPDDDLNEDNKQNVSSESSDVEDCSEMERLRRYLAQKLRLVDLSANEQGDESQQSVLRKLDLNGIVEYIKENANCKIITMAGAGISTCKYTYIIYTVIYVYI